MRPVDADALRDEIDSWGCNDYDKYDFINAIDNAPTVDITETILKFRNTAYQNGFTTGLNKRLNGDKKETTFDDYLKEQLKDPEFRKEWKKLCDEDMRGDENESIN